MVLQPEPAEIVSAVPEFLDVQRLTKRYGARRALDEVSFLLPPGVVVCLSGANGAGKSTLLRCLAGLTSFEGRARLAGAALPPSRETRRDIAYLPQSVALLESATVGETLEFFAQLRGVDAVASALPEGFLPPVDARIGSLSGGNRQRVALAVALLGSPRLILLDEPLASLDASGCEMFLRAVRRCADQGATVVISSPAHRELMDVVDRLIVLVDGSIEEDSAATVVPGIAPTSRPAAEPRGIAPALAVARWEMRAAVRTRWVLAGGLAFAAGVLAVTLIGLRSLAELGLTGIGPASAGLLGLGLILLPLLALLVGAGSVAGERERGILPMVLVQPVDRSSIVLGVFAGLTSAVWLIAFLGLGFAGIAYASLVRGPDLMPFVVLCAAIIAVATVGVALGVAFSAVARGRAHATAWAAVAWFVFAFGIDLAIAGLAAPLHIGPLGLLSAILLNPIEAARVLALLGADLRGGALGPFGAYLSQELGSGTAMTALVGALAAWVGVPLALASVSLKRRDV
ncbi:MAG: ATP-binding cassette domain-containing protein [Actinomycetota bacterium]